MTKNSNNLEHSQILFDPLAILARAKKLKRFPVKYFSAIFRRSRGRISQAFDGQAPEILRKIDKHCTILENRNIKRKTNSGKKINSK